MAKKVIELEKEALEKTLNSIKGIPDYSGCCDENDVDKIVAEYLIEECHYEKRFIKGHKTGNKKIDDSFPSWHGEKKGKPDLTVYNLFGENEVSLIIEDKALLSQEDPEPQVVYYAKGLNEARVGRECRVVIANHPNKQLIVKALVEDKFIKLKINGEEVRGFFGKELLKIIYDNPNYNELILKELVVKPFTQKDFQRIINSLKTLYRQAPEIQNTDETSINFTIAFVALKMIAVKVKKPWDSLKSVSDIVEFLNNIVGDSAIDSNMREKYSDVFRMLDKGGQKVVFDFEEILKSVDTREKDDHRVNGKINTDYNSIIMQVHDIIAALPDEDIPIDLFGEVYECLASNKTKSVLGQFFTRRHIIKVIVRMFFSEDDIEDIVDNKKTIGDCCCGTGGFLTESFKYIKEYYEAKNGQLADISDLINEIILGYDIDASNIGRTRVNMTLAGAGLGFPGIKKANTLTAPLSEQTQRQSAEIRKNINYILTNVPYGKGDVAYKDLKSDYEYLKSNNVKRLELNFVLKIIDMLKDGGRASIIVPEGLLGAPMFASFREYLLERCQVETIISLPKAAFAPYTKWKTYVIFLKKRTRNLHSIDEVIAKNEKIWAYIVDNDGYANSDKRFRTDLVDENGAYLHDELSPYMDSNGVMHSSIIEQRFEAKDEDVVCVWKNEWNKEVVGKKYGYISIGDIIQKKTTFFETINTTVLKKRVIEFWNGNYDRESITETEYIELKNILSVFEKRNSYKITSKLWKGSIKNPIKEEFQNIFEALEIDVTLGAKEVNNKLTKEANKNEVLPLPLYKKFISLLPDAGTSFVFSKSTLVELIDSDQDVAEKVLRFLSSIQVGYNESEMSFVDMLAPKTIYFLPLVPEEYFRAEKKEVISLDELQKEVSLVSSLIDELFGDNKNES